MDRPADSEYWNTIFESAPPVCAGSNPSPFPQPNRRL